MTTNVCWCGCGGATKNRFVPGHDAKFHSQAKKVARGLLDENTLPPLPHQEAADEFEKWVAKTRLADAAKAAAEKTGKAEATEGATRTEVRASLVARIAELQARLAELDGDEAPATTEATAEVAVS